MPSTIAVYSLMKIDQRASMSELTPIGNAVGQMINEDGILKYPQLFALPKAILSLSHGNVVPERWFSINK